MKTNNKISAYILRGSTTALFFSCVIVALCSAIHLPEQSAKARPPQDNAVFGANAHQNRSLSFADRVAYQRVIEDIYWRHRIWPKERPDPKPPLDAVMSQAMIEQKVQDYLRHSELLEQDWQKPITPEQLQAEMDRMAQHSKQPEVLRELFAALANDPFVIAECLARPVLAERFANSDPVAAEPALSARRTGVPPAHPAQMPPQKPVLAAWLANSKTQAPMKMAATSSATYTFPVIANPSGTCIDDTWTATTTTNAPLGTAEHTAVWTGSEMIVWGGAGAGNTGGRYNPGTDSWTPTSTTNAPTRRYRHTAVWTGSEMIVWGGFDGGGGLNTGGRDNPITDSWTAISTTNAPTARYFHTAVWTGSEMIVWGGGGGSSGILNTGGRYNPSTNSWTATTTTNAPTGRWVHTAVWTDSEMIVWGGEDENFVPLNTGGRYDPSTDSWAPTSTTNAPAGRFFHTAVWTGSEMIVWGGDDLINLLNTGGRYNPSTDSWTATSTTNTPTVRQQHTAVWTGTEMIVWGGYVYGVYLNTGGRYCAQAASPTPTPTPSPQITLSAAGRKVNGVDTVRLTWSGATSSQVDIYRCVQQLNGCNPAVIATAPNNGGYIDSTGHTGPADVRYRVCEAGTQTCSKTAGVIFRH